MKYEAPICEVVRINDADIIRTSFGLGDENDTPDIPATPNNNYKGGNAK